MKFLVQTYNGIVTHDFSFTLIESCKYQNWLRSSNDFEVVLTDEELLENHIPIGSIEFVQEYLNKFYGLKTIPLNIPEDLHQQKYLKRNIKYGKKEDIEDIKFIKSTTQIKKYTEIVKSNYNDIPDDDYLISDVISIDSEWRTFVYNGLIVGLQNYSGDFLKFPDVSLIKEMVRDFKNCPPAYTLDVGVNKKDTFIIEAHDFFSCGLYGFSDHRYLPFMFIKWFNWFLEKNNQN